MSKAKGTVHIRVTRTVPSVKLCSSILDRQVHIGKKTFSKKELNKTGFQCIICFGCRFFDLDFSLKSFRTGPPSEILCHKNNTIDSIHVRFNVIKSLL